VVIGVLIVGPVLSQIASAWVGVSAGWLGLFFGFALIWTIDQVAGSALKSIVISRGYPVNSRKKIEGAARFYRDSGPLQFEILKRYDHSVSEISHK
jgi:hypothetical protein